MQQIKKEIVLNGALASSQSGKLETPRGRTSAPRELESQQSLDGEEQKRTFVRPGGTKENGFAVGSSSPNLRVLDFQSSSLVASNPFELASSAKLLLPVVESASLLPQLFSAFCRQ